ncbi:biotin/lipoyl-binding protein [Dehalobacter restrictus]|uniref:biotin/lipoyl-binding protein n=1 Tax=Dehalobacter restrictus TaxID=55583 RepID=UPI000A02A422
MSLTSCSSRLNGFDAYSGTIYSAKTMNVCSSVTYPVEEIRVNVGDKVKAGQIMAVLDTESLSTDLDKAQLTLKVLAV